MAGVGFVRKHTIGKLHFGLALRGPIETPNDNTVVAVAIGETAFWQVLNRTQKLHKWAQASERQCKEHSDDHFGFSIWSFVPKILRETWIWLLVIAIGDYLIDGFLGFLLTKKEQSIRNLGSVWSQDLDASLWHRWDQLSQHSDGNKVPFTFNGVLELLFCVVLLATSIHATRQHTPKVLNRV